MSKATTTRAGSSVGVARALSHPTRVRILMSMNAPRRRLSPKEFCDETGLPMGHASYHFRELAQAGCIELVGQAQRRGATEHYYYPVERAMAWTREWESLGPAVRQNLAATALRGWVEAVGRAVDTGTFEALPDAHLSWDTMRVDAEGWKEVTSIMEEALTRLMEVGAQSAERISDDNPSFLVSTALAAFEAPPRDA